MRGDRTGQCRQAYPNHFRTTPCISKADQSVYCPDSANYTLLSDTGDCTCSDSPAQHSQRPLSETLPAHPIQQPIHERIPWTPPRFAGYSAMGSSSIKPRTIAQLRPVISAPTSWPCSPRSASVYRRQRPPRLPLVQTHPQYRPPLTHPTTNNPRLDQE